MDSILFPCINSKQVGISNTSNEFYSRKYQQKLTVGNELKNISNDDDGIFVALFSMFT